MIIISCGVSVSDVVHNYRGHESDEPVCGSPIVSVLSALHACKDRLPQGTNTIHMLRELVTQLPVTGNTVESLNFTTLIEQCFVMPHILYLLVQDTRIDRLYVCEASTTVCR